MITFSSAVPNLFGLAAPFYSNKPCSTYHPGKPNSSKIKRYDKKRIVESYQLLLDYLPNVFCSTLKTGRQVFLFFCFLWHPNWKSLLPCSYLLDRPESVPSFIMIASTYTFYLYSYQYYNLMKINIILLIIIARLLS